VAGDGEDMLMVSRKSGRHWLLAVVLAAALAAPAAMAAVGDEVELEGVITDIARKVVVLQLSGGEKVRVPRAAVERGGWIARSGEHVRMYFALDALDELNRS
jgi:hypothetical protein